MVHGETKVMGDENGKDPFKMPKEKGMFKVVASGSQLTTHAIVERIIQNRFVIILLNNQFFDPCIHQQSANC